jgi:serine/threonine protein kinase/Tol biopolymer transport system component
MGEVYKARDIRLDRFVALKVLPAEFAADRDRLRRFEQEARATSALNHPNILGVHDVGLEGSVSFLVTELVEGKTLRELLLHGLLPRKKVIDYAVQIADGLASAHEAGVVHRDLKPGNIMVSRDGFVKILDFGLAKLPTPAPILDSAGSESTTQPVADTDSGAVIGTVEYMSPEQAGGKLVDFRSDQFAFGSVLYEMTTGKRPFRRGTTIETQVAILQDDPEAVSPATARLPAPLIWILERCLSKTPADRFLSTRDLARDLAAVRDHTMDAANVLEASPTNRWRVLLPAVLVAGALAIALLLGFARHRKASVPPHFQRLTFRHGNVSRALFVPHSTSILYTATWEGEKAKTYVTLPNSPALDRALDAEPQLPMGYSANGSEVLAVLTSSLPFIGMTGTLAWWPVLGGRPRQILERAGWSDWDPRARLIAVVRDTGATRQLEILDEEGTLKRVLFRTSGGLYPVRFSPSGDSVAFCHFRSMYDSSGEVCIYRTDGSAGRRLTPFFDVCSGLSWNPATGELWFAASPEGYTSTDVWKISASGDQRLVHAMTGFVTLADISADGKKCLLITDEERTTMLVKEGDQPPKDRSWLDSTFVTDVSRDGRLLAFFDGGSTRPMKGTWIRPIEGGDAVHVGEGTFARFSPDGKWVVALTPAQKGPPQLVLYPTGPGTRRQLTASGATHFAPSFARADLILFGRAEVDKQEVWSMKTDGSGLTRVASDCNLPSANPTQQSFLCIGGQGNRQIFVYPMPAGAGRRLHELPAGERFRYARWNASGEVIFAITNARRMLTIAPLDGRVVHDEVLPATPADSVLYTAALSEDGSLRAYTVKSFNSSLYLATNLE